MSNILKAGMQRKQAWKGAGDFQHLLSCLRLPVPRISEVMCD